MSSLPIVDIKIGRTCYESHPCQHRAKITYGDGNITDERLMGAREIIQPCTALGKKVPEHFDYLKIKN